MTTHPIVPQVLGPAAEQLLVRDVSALASATRRLRATDWRTTTSVGDAPVVRILEHLADGAARFARTIRRHYEDHEPGPLFAPFDDPTTPPVIERDAIDIDIVRERYRVATVDLAQALSVTRQDDWTWPVWSPLGGLETLAEAVRRWLAHHYVHRHDIAAAIHQRDDQHDDTVRLVVEFALDAIARRGVEGLSAPYAFEIVTSLPGAGAWTLWIDPPGYRLERGAGSDVRATVTASGTTVWRTVFGRGASWDDLQAHGADDVRAGWRRLVEHIAAPRTGRLGRVQHA